MVGEKGSPQPGCGIGGKGDAAAGVKPLCRPLELDGGLLKRIGTGGAGRHAPPGVHDQAQVVAHQVIAGTATALGHGHGSHPGATGPLLPALNPARQLEHRAPGERLVVAAGPQPIGQTRMEGKGSHGHSDRLLLG